MKTLEEINEYIIKTLEKKLKVFVNGSYITIKKFIELQEFCKDLCYTNFDEFFDFDIYDYIDINIKIYVEEGLIGIFPNNLFTALLMKNKLNNFNISKEQILQMNEQNIYTIEDKSFYFDEEKNSILNIKPH